MQTVGAVNSGVGILGSNRRECLVRVSERICSSLQEFLYSAITWKYPGCILQGDNSVGEFYSIALTNSYQQADTGTKMIHIDKNTRITILSRGISAGHGQNSYRGMVEILNGGGRAQLHAMRSAFNESVQVRICRRRLVC